MDKREYKELSEQAAAGSTTAFARLYSTIYREMYYTAYYSLANDTDTIEVITSTVRDGFSAISKLRAPEAFRTFIMKTLCARIRAKFKEYSAEPPEVPEMAEGYDIKYEFGMLEDNDRLITSMYIGGKFQPDEIAAYTGFGSAMIKKSLERVLSGFELD